ncbi:MULTISPECIES: hypothetical protein [unclassified Novosphingobium]|uniref:hypothetical protein n=1 Tax=unclassified Novosphingobium TaxID=2644732 RepID=UPI00146C567C|nr:MULTISPECIES: hypothetical protein [unclassified Novosphingobium]NMN06942.1 hypothetical protein [Novosphingobium sp. SG919]NMN89471.1 hypothetical protein [Novosphingobium sp. SG916]
MARMIIRTLGRAAKWSPAALAFALAACGDGGGVASSNLPNTPPSPPPKPTNADLVGSLISESFVNDARTETAYMPITSARPNTVTSSPLTIAYNASTQTYTVTTQGRTQDFGPAQKDATLTNADATVYKRTDGTLTETLSLSKNSSTPGTPDAPRFRYVGAGLWQRTQTDASNSTTTMDYFTYGVPTPASAMPNSGTATFAVRVDGEAGYSKYILVLQGSGRFSVDFASGKLSGSGNIDGYVDGRITLSNLAWSSQASLAAGGTTFSGSFKTGDRQGGLSGRFYGPNHEELGAVWDSKLLDNVVASGTILGRDTATMPSNTSLADLLINEDLGGLARSVQYSKSAATNTYVALNLNRVDGDTLDIDYSETQHALVLGGERTGLNGLRGPLTSAIKDNAASDATYDVYSARDLTNQNRDGTFRISRPGPGNQLIALTYTGFGNYESAEVKPSASSPQYVDTAFGFGLSTPASAMPRTGSANYTGIIVGYSGLPSGDAMRPYAISGDVQMAYDFGGAKLAGTLNPVATDRDTGTAYALGAYTFSGQGDAGKSTFAGTFDKVLNVPGTGNTNGAVTGQFTGPHAEEFYASWHAGMIDPKGGSNIDMGGVIVGKQSN